MQMQLQRTNCCSCRPKEAQADEGNQKEYIHQVIKKTGSPLESKGGRPPSSGRDPSEDKPGVHEQGQGNLAPTDHAPGFPFFCPAQLKPVPDARLCWESFDTDGSGALFFRILGQNMEKKRSKQLGIFALTYTSSAIIPPVMNEASIMTLDGTLDAQA